ncbi:MAG: hypothetical protein INH41_29035 [Myxococcaceae bacterium]|nr:hypothetical protein [Myxococcaceae bacterium]
MAVSSRPGEAWVVLDSGRFYRSTGGLFAEVSGLMLAGARDVYLTPSGKVFAVSSGRTALSCTAADCTAAANHVQAMTVSSNETWSGVCGAGEVVFGFGTGSSSTVSVLYQFTGGAWVKVSPNLGVSSPRWCQVGPGGEVFIAGTDGVSRYESGAATVEPIDLAGQPAASWVSLALSIRGTEIVEAFVVGGGGGYRFARRNQASRGWLSLAPNSVGQNLSTVVAVGVGEFLAAGTPSTSTGARFLSWNGSAWVPSAAPPPPASITNVRDACATDTREVFLVGNDSVGGYVILRGRR